MSPDDVITFFNGLVDDEPDTDTVKVLMDNAYTKRNDSRFWTFLMKLDTSISHLTSDLWTTEKTIPTDFDSVAKLFVGSSDNEYLPVPFEMMLAHQGSANRYTVDYANAKLRFLGPGPGQTAYLWYKYTPTSLIGLSDAAMALTTTIVWPKRFCPILAYDMANLYFGGIDADMVSRAMAPYQKAAHQELVNAMVQWDTRRRMQLFDNSSSPQRSGSRLSPADVVDMPGD